MLSHAVKGWYQSAASRRPWTQEANVNVDVWERRIAPTAEMACVKMPKMTVIAQKTVRADRDSLVRTELIHRGFNIGIKALMQSASRWRHHGKNTEISPAMDQIGPHHWVYMGCLWV